AVGRRVHGADDLQIRGRARVYVGLAAAAVALQARIDRDRALARPRRIAGERLGERLVVELLDRAAVAARAAAAGRATTPASPFRIAEHPADAAAAAHPVLGIARLAVR